MTQNIISGLSVCLKSMFKSRWIKINAYVVLLLFFETLFIQTTFMLWSHYPLSECIHYLPIFSLDVSSLFIIIFYQIFNIVRHLVLILFTLHEAAEWPLQIIGNIGGFVLTLCIIMLNGTIWILFTTDSPFETLHLSFIQLLLLLAAHHMRKGPEIEIAKLRKFTSDVSYYGFASGKYVIFATVITFGGRLLYTVLTEANFMKLEFHAEITTFWSLYSAIGLLYFISIVHDVWLSKQMDKYSDVVSAVIFKVQARGILIPQYLTENMPTSLEQSKINII